MLYEYIILKKNVIWVKKNQIRAFDNQRIAILISLQFHASQRHGGSQYEETILPYRYPYRFIEKFAEKQNNEANTNLLGVIAPFDACP